MSEKNKKPKEEKQPDPSPAPADNTAEIERLKGELAQAKAATKAAKDAEEALRGNNGKLLGEKKLAESVIADLGMPVEKAKKILAAMGNIEEAEMIAEGKHDEVFAARMDKFKSDTYEPVVAERDDWKGKYEALKSRYDSKAAIGPLMEGWEAAGGKADKFKYAQSQALSVFRLNDEEVLVPYKDGVPIPGKGGEGYMTPQEWAAGFLLTEPDFKKQNVGTDARGGAPAKVSINGNPWSPKYKGADKYGARLEISRTAPQEAKRLKAEAGFK